MQVLSRPVTVRQLGATLREPNYIHTEFKKLPLPLVTLDQVPSGVERKNRYSNVLPSESVYCITQPSHLTRPHPHSSTQPCVAALAAEQPSFRLHQCQLHESM